MVSELTKIAVLTLFLNNVTAKYWNRNVTKGEREVLYLNIALKERQIEITNADG